MTLHSYSHLSTLIILPDRCDNRMSLVQSKLIHTGYEVHLGSIVVCALCLAAGHPDLVGCDGPNLLGKRPPCLLPKLEQQLVLILKPWQQQQLSCSIVEAHAEERKGERLYPPATLFTLKYIRMD